VQTFIRNAAGKALTDSPALNAHSRAVLVPLTHSDLSPTVITVPGPGPAELPKNSTTDPSRSANVLPPKPISTETPSDVLSSEDASLPATLDNADDADADQDEEEDDDPSKEADPYSNLDGAFGNYLADEPRPMQRGQNGEEDDLLF
jgi:AP-2 complex subunit beta-1